MKKRMSLIIVLIMVISVLSHIDSSASTVDTKAVIKTATKQLKQKGYQSLTDLTKYVREYREVSVKEFRFHYSNMKVITINKKLTIKGTATNDKLVEAIVSYFSNQKKYNTFDIEKLTVKNGTYTFKIHCYKVLKPDQIEYVRKEATERIKEKGYRNLPDLAKSYYDYGEITKEKYDYYLTEMPDLGAPWWDYPSWGLQAHEATVDQLIMKLVGIVTNTSSDANFFYIGEYRGIDEGGNYLFKLHQVYLDEEF